MSEKQHQRLVLLNQLFSRTVSRAPQEHSAPIHSFEELISILIKRSSTGQSVEFIGPKMLEGDGAGHECVRIKSIALGEQEGWNYATFLFEHIDAYTTKFPVVDIRTFAGRELEAEADERGATTAHFAVRYPAAGAHDDGSYRCALEHVAPISRSMVGLVFSRQLRTHCKEAGWTFEVSTMQGKKRIDKSYEYHAKLELVADVSRSFFGVIGGQRLSSMVFIKRSERHAIGEPSSVKTEEVLGDVEIRISAAQGPSSPDEQRTWVSHLRAHFSNLGYQTKLYFRSSGGSLIAGNSHGELAGAADLVMCPKETILLEEPSRKWRPAIDQTIAAQLRAVLANDALWQQDK